MAELLEDTVTGELYDPDKLPLQVCQSNAGYYIGRLEPGGCPYSRESGYFRTIEEAEVGLFIVLYAQEILDSKTNTNFSE